MEKLRAIRQDARDRVLAARAIQRVVDTEDFANYYEKSSGRETVEQLIISGNKDGLDAWMAACRNEFDFAALSIRELRQLGSKLRVRNYNRIPKTELLREIHNAKEADREEAGSIDCEALSESPGCGSPGGCNCQVHVGYRGKD